MYTHIYIHVHTYIYAHIHICTCICARPARRDTLQASPSEGRRASSCPPPPLPVSHFLRTCKRVCVCAFARDTGKRERVRARESVCVRASTHVRQGGKNRNATKHKYMQVR